MLIDLFFRIINFFEFRKNKVLSWIKSPNFNHQIKDLGKNANKINITFIDTDFLVGGSQKITLDIVSRLPINRFKTAYIATECFGMEENWREKFMEVFDNLVDLRMIRNKSVKLLKVLSLFRPDIVIIVNSEIAYSLLPQIKKDLPEVYIIDLIHGKFDEKNRHANSLGSIKNIDMRITGTHGLRKMILDKYYKGKFLSAYRKNISVVRYGTNIFPMDNRANKYYFRDKLNIPHNAFVVSFVAAIAQHKDPLSVIEMGNRLKEDKSVHFILAGDGPLRKRVRYEISKNYLSSFVHFLTDCDNSHELIFESNVLILPSETESFGLVILEAMARGTPAIAANVGFQSEIINNNITGFLVERNHQMLDNCVKNILRLKNDEVLYEQIKRNALFKVKKDFDIDISVNQYIDIFEKIFYQQKTVS